MAHALTLERIFQSLAAMHSPRAIAIAAAATATAVSLSAVAFTPQLAFAQVSGEQAAAVADATKSNLPPDSFGGELLFGKFDEDYFLSLALRINFDREYFGVGFQVPVRFRVIDRAPENDDYGGIIRREDWDELSDFLRVIRYVYVGQADKKGPFYVRVGELAGLTVGHGTIMYRYRNSVDQDVWHTGLNAAVNIGAFGAEVLTGDVVDPYIVGGRLSVRPLQLALGEEDSFWNKLVFGVSYLADARAPYSLQVAVPPGGMAPVAVLDEHRHPVVEGERVVGVVGADVGLELLSTELLSITPYIDLNKIGRVANGVGLHIGVLWQFRFPLVIDTLTIDARTEYRRVSGDYIGPYFNTSYEIERYQVFRGPPFTPKLASIINNTVPSRNGVFFDLLAGLPEFVFIGGEYIDYDGGEADGTLRLSLEIPALQVVQFSAMYYRVGISGANDLFKFKDDRSAIVASAAIPLYSVFSLQLRFIRTWQADPNSGEYIAVDDVSAGVGFNLTF